MAKTAHILTIEHRSYAVSSTSAAVKLIDLLSKLQPVDYNSDAYNDYQNSHYFPKPGKIEVSLKMNEACYPKDAPLRLPRPKKGTRRCPCGHSDVSPGEDCPSCGDPYPN